MKLEIKTTEEIHFEHNKGKKWIAYDSFCKTIFKELDLEYIIVEKKILLRKK